MYMLWASLGSILISGVN